MEGSATLKKILARKEAGIGELRARRQMQGERLARWVEVTPEALDQGLAVLRRRLERAYCHARELHLRWLNILETSTREEVAELLRGRSEEAEQLRSCAPFVPSGAQQ
jgi:hypothetical protein